ncbi:MAG: hypothetical protein IH899_14275 [Planctomycetes bacterium]|nr:hypothetical protein [Planctomycetota bacterium]
MATTKAPLFGLDASGALGGSIVFSKWRGRTYVRRLSIPSNPRSGLQVGMRSSMKFITQDFTNLTVAQKAAWDTLAAVTNITQLNAQVQDAQRRTRRNLGIRRGPAESAGTTPSLPVIDTVTAQPKTLVLDWTAGATAPEYAWMIFRDPVTAFTPDISNMIGIVAAATLTFTDIGLTTGVEQFYSMKGVNFDGELGALAVENSGTPT